MYLLQCIINIQSVIIQSLIFMVNAINRLNRVIRVPVFRTVDSWAWQSCAVVMNVSINKQPQTDDRYTRDDNYKHSSPTTSPRSSSSTNQTHLLGDWEQLLTLYLRSASNIIQQINDCKFDLRMSTLDEINRYYWNNIHVGRVGNLNENIQLCTTKGPNILNAWANQRSWLSV